MNNIDFNPIILVIIAAFIKGFDFLIKELVNYFKHKEKEKKEEIEAKKSDYQKAKEVYEKLEVLNTQEDILKDKETARMMANNMSVLLIQTKSSRIITDIVLNTPVERFILFHTHNGAGQPNGLKPYKVSYLQYNAVKRDEINNYQNLEVDYEYSKMLIAIQKSPDQKAILKVSEMPECFLKDIYIREKVKYSEVHFLCAISTGIIYTSTATSEEMENFNLFRFEIKLAVSKLRHIFEEERSRVFRDAIDREQNESQLKEIYLEKVKLKNSLL
jgi:hypothetical protein